MDCTVTVTVRVDTFETGTIGKVDGFCTRFMHFRRCQGGSAVLFGLFGLCANDPAGWLTQRHDRAERVCLWA